MITDPLIAVVARPRGRDVDPSWVARQEFDMDAAIMRDLFGSDDLTDPLADLLNNYAHQIAQRSVRLVAVRGIDPAALSTGEYGLPELSYEASVDQPRGRVVGAACVDWPLTDNLTKAYVWAEVAPDERRRGLGSRLLRACEELAARNGRTILQGWSTHGVPRDGEPAVVPASGVSSIAVDAAAAFAQHHGYELEQCERHSELRLPLPDGLLDALWDASIPKADDYDIRCYEGPLPRDLVPAMCDLMTHFSVAEPRAGLDGEAEVWTPDRYIEQDERRIANGRLTLAALGIHRASGAIVAATELSLPTREHQHLAYQNVTVVDADHRGHRLGWLIKVANLRELAARQPERTAVHTWNAHENDHMLAINHALGFEERTAEGAWQKRARDPQ